MPLPYPHPTSAAASASMRGNRRSETTPELALRSALHTSGYRFRKDYPIEATGLRARADIAFTRQRVAVFVDGCFWHRCPQHGTSPQANLSYWGPKLAMNVRRDRRVDRALRGSGWAVIRIWEHEVPEVAARTIRAALGRRRAASGRTLSSRSR